MFYDKLNIIAIENNKSITQLLLENGCAKSAGTAYKNNKCKPGADLLIKLSIDYNKTIEWLLEEEIQKYKESI